MSESTDGRMALIEHLRELRGRLAKGLLAVTVGIIVSFIFWEPILALLQQPYCEAVDVDNCGLYTFGPLEAFAIRLKVSSIAGVVLTSPLWLYQVGAFITPALHRKEKRYAASFLVAGTALFAAGCAMAYVTLDKGLAFLLTVGGDGVVALTGLKSYLSFVTLTLLAFGIGFLFPLFILFLHIGGVLPLDRLRAWRRGMVVGIAAAAAVLTPSTDPYSFLALALPLYVLYEACILIARVRERALRRRAADDPEAGLDDDTASYVDPRPSPL